MKKDKREKKKTRCKQRGNLKYSNINISIKKGFDNIKSKKCKGVYRGEG